MGFLEFISNLKPASILSSILAATACGYPTGCFVGGMILAKVSNGFDIIGRLFIGLIFLVFGTFGGGFVPKDESGLTDKHNLWVYIVPSIIIFFLIILLAKWKSGPPPNH